MTVNDDHFQVERYEPRANKWTPVAPMSTRRKHLGCAVFDGQIYAVGGRDDCTELSSAERYVMDPGYYFDNVIQPSFLYFLHEGEKYAKLTAIALAR